MNCHIFTIANAQFNLFGRQLESVQLENAAFAEAMKILEAEVEAEPSSRPEGGVVQALTTPGPDIPALREQLAVLVSTGKTKEAIGVQLTHKQVKGLSEKDVGKYAKRYQAHVGSKTTDSLINGLISILTAAVGMAINIKDIEAYQKELRNEYSINHELSTLAGTLAVKYGRLLAAARAALITTKDINFKRKEATIPQQSTTNVEELHTSSE